MAGYLFAKSALEAQLDRPMAQLLAKCNETVIEARRQLSRGRGNVVEDIEATGWDSARFSVVGIEVDKAVFGPDMTPPTTAAAAAYVGAGYCDDHAFVAAMCLARLVADELGPGHEVKLVNNNEHRWAELWIDGGKIQVACDPWCEGPAILSQDSAMEATGKSWSYDHESAVQAVQEHERAILHLEARPDVRQYVDARVQDMRDQGSMPEPDELYGSMSVVSREAHAALQSRLETLKLKTNTSMKVMEPLMDNASLHDAMNDLMDNLAEREQLLHEIRAVGARDAGWTVNSVVSATEAIVTAARHLRADEATTEGRR